jgi:uncharacterized membrane protein YdjX (TVP38/TMEM64 family)
MRGETTLRWVGLTFGVLAIILVPFVLFGHQIEIWTTDFLSSATKYSLVVAAVLILLLSVDFLAPIPSSLVSTAAGFFLGVVGGTLASLLGMTISCLLGYWLAARLGRPVATRIVKEDELGRLEGLYERIGDWVMIVCRPVPMLAEASVWFAGLGRMRVWRYVLLVTLANLGISAVYATVGALSATVSSFLLAFAGAILIPLIGMLVLRKLR